MILGALITVLSATSFGIHNASNRRSMLGTGPTQALYVTVGLGVVLFALAALASGQLFSAGDISLKGHLLLAAAGIVHFVQGRYCSYRAISILGTNRATPLIATSLIYSVSIAVFVLGEHVTPITMAGIALMVIGPALIVERPRRATVAAGAAAAANVSSAEPSGSPTKPARSQLEGYGFALLGAIGYGLSPNLVRAGLEGTGLGVMGGFTSYIAAGLLLLLLLALPGMKAPLAGTRQASGWFILSAVAIFLAQLLRYVALGLAPVTIVAAVGQLSPMFSLLFSFIINRNIESFAPQVLVGIVFSVVGSFILVLSVA